MSDKMSHIDVVEYTLKLVVVFRFVCLMVVGLMVVFNNSIFYLMSVLFMSSYILFFLVTNNVLGVLIFILIVIVYVGAMIILIGYICAVSPNPVLLPRLNLVSVLFLRGLFFFVLFPFEFKFYNRGVKGVVVSDVFFTR